MLFSNIAYFKTGILHFPLNQDTPQLFEITGTQWEFARKLYNENEGDKYKIYVVSNAGNENAKIKSIKNPTKLWKEGKLYAHPVHFKL